MKLHNKKTGVIGCIEYVMRTIEPITGEPLLTVRYKDDSGINCYIDYKTIKEFNDEWEDYKPAEPLIKDEKIRKAVRVWAGTIGATKNIVFDGSKKLYSFFYENNKGGFEKLLIYGDNDLEELKRYSITELCGEEE